MQADRLLEFALRDGHRALVYVLVDLGEIPFGRLASDPALRAALGLLKFASERLLPAAGQIREALRQLPTEDPLLNAWSEHLETVTGAVGSEAAGVSPQDDPRTKEYLMATLVERLLQKGRTEGRVEGWANGWAEGKAETLLRQLMLRFGAVPDGVRARVRAAGGSDLNAWLDAILEAPDLEAVFASRSVNRA